MAGAEAFRSLAMGRVSARHFLKRDIAASVVEDMLAVTQRAPSSFNVQPWVCIVVRSEEQRALMGRAMLSESNKRRVVDAPLTAVFVGLCCFLPDAP